MENPEVEDIISRVAITTATAVGSAVVEGLAKEREELHQSPISPHCEKVLETPPKCWDFRGIRSYVMCKAWDIMEKEKRIRLPVGEAWIEARKACVI